MRLLFVLLLSTLAVPAQTTLTTLFASNNGGSTGGTVFFDLAAGGGDVVINAMDLNFGQTAGNAGSVDLYTIPNTRVGNEGNAGAWTLFDTIAIAATGGTDVPSVGVFQNGIPLIIPANTSIGVALVCSSNLSHRYTGTGTSAGQQTFEQCPLTLMAGAASNTPFGGAQFEPRVVNTNIYFVHSAGCATVDPVGTGCLPANELQLVEDNRPVQLATPNPLTCSVTGLGPNDTFLVGIVGTGNIMLPLSAIGMPASCTLYPSPDFLTVDLVTGGAMQWTIFPLPPLSNPLLGFEFHAQVSAHDAALNFANSRSSNGLKYVVGDA